jgi:hypothetical protein
VDGRKGGAMPLCLMLDLGRGGSVATSATSTLVEVGASAVIENASRRQHTRQQRGVMELHQRRVRRYSVSHIDDLG